VKEIPTVGSPFFGAFPSDRVPKSKKDLNVHFFFIFCRASNLYLCLYNQLFALCHYVFKFLTP